MIKTIRERWAAKVAMVFFFALTAWWVFIFASDLQQTTNHYFFGATYGLICLWGAYRGFIHSRRWGGLNSVIGRALTALSLGLLAQEFGQLVFSYYNIFLNVEIPYPSLADLGYFGSIPLYVWGIIALGKASGVSFNMQKFTSQAQAVLIPLLTLIASYLLFLRGYEFDYTQPLKIFLDFGYPLGQAVYVSLAILTFSLTRKILGGAMREKVLLLIFAFAAQYLSDYNFLFQTSHGTWVNGGYGDYLYFVSYFLMTLGLISFYDERVGELVFSKIVSPTQDVYSQVILKIINEQQLIVGPVAISEALKVSDLKVSPDLKFVQVTNGGKEALEGLVKQYEKLFGQASVEVCKRVSKEILATLPSSGIPDILK